MTPAQTADPHVASILALTAMGLDRVNQKAPPAAPNSPPLVTEGQGSAPRRASLSKLEQNIARERGITEGQWAKNTEGFVSGRAQNLED